MTIKLKLFPTAGALLTGCGTPEWCAKCELHEKVCPGSRGHCTTKKTCAQRECYGECNSCGGGPAHPNSAPAICCKSPMKDLLLTSVRGPRLVGGETFDYTKRPGIFFDTQGIVVTQGSVGSAFKTGESPYAPEVGVIGVNLRHLWSTLNGWWSRDIRDYLRVGKNMKLILFTSMYDNVLEAAWSKGLHEEDFAKLGFDHWQHLSFSMYAEDSPMQAYYMALRSLRAASSSASWFAEDMPFGHLQPAWATARLLEQTAKIPQIIINAQFMGTEQSQLLAHAQDVQALHRLLPVGVSFWIHGPIRPFVMRFLKQITKGRRLYFLSTGPWIQGHKGQLLGNDGKAATAGGMKKSEIILENQRTYMRLAAC